MASDIRQPLLSPPSLEEEEADSKGCEGVINKAAAVEALYMRGLLWLAENIQLAEDTAQKNLRYRGGYQSGIARTQRPNVIRPFGITEIDALLPEGGILPGSAHELFIESEVKNAPSALVSTIGATVHRSYLRETSSLAKLTPAKRTPAKLAVWIGKNVWPTPHFLDHVFHTPAYRTSLESSSLCSAPLGDLSQCLFLDPPSEKAIFWSIDTALRSPAVGVVIASLPKISFALSRRLLLAARTGNTIGLFYRSIAKGGLSKDTPTAFTTRWLIRPEVSITAHPRWTIELLKYKGSAPRHTTWSVELCGSDDDQNVPLHLSPPMADRRHASEASGESKRSRQRA